MNWLRQPLSILALVALLAAPALAGTVTITAVGDVMLAGSGTPTYLALGYDYPFAATSRWLKEGDITIGNLEAPLTSGGIEFRDKRFRFRVPPRAAEALQRAGFDVMTLANNHMLDYGGAGLSDTLHHLQRVGIAATGAGKNLNQARLPALITVRDSRVAFLAYSLTYPAEFYATRHQPGTAPGETAQVEEDIRQARRTADLVIVSFHWGGEKERSPKPYQIALAHAAIDAGADLIIGHHPHVLQGIEFYRGVPILYSLGNFAFGSMSPACDRSVIARITLGKGEPLVELIPLNVLNDEVLFQPQPLTGEQGEEVIRQLALISTPFGSRFEKGGDRFVALPASNSNLARQRPQ